MGSEMCIRDRREYYLNEQMKAIQRELGNDDGEGGDEVAELQSKIDTMKLSKEAKAKANAELKKLRGMAPMSAEATVIRNYLDTLLGIPWGKRSKLKRDIAKAQDILDADHFALEKVKDRIIEYLAVQARTNKLKGPILCLVGPPAWARRRWANRLPRPRGVNSSANLWAACVMKRKFEGTVGPISVQCPVKLLQI